MKLLSAILAILMIYLSVMPCDDINETKNSGVESSFLTQCNQHNDGHAESDDCSPFCICQCCHTPVIMNTFFVRTSVVSFTIQDKLGYYESLNANSFINTVWHPPQLS